MGEWIEVDQKAFNEPIERKFDLTVFVSPYDMPEAIKGEYDQQLKRLVIDFKYMTEERPAKAPRGEEHVLFYTGEDSNRILKIVINVDAMQASEVNLVLESAIEHLNAYPERRLRRGNYTAAQRAIKQNSQRLFAGLAGAH